MRTLLLVEAAALCSGFLLIAPPAATAQIPVIPGVTGTIALPGTVDDEYRAANTVAADAADGAKHVFHFLAHDGKGNGLDSLSGLHEGATVVVHYAAAGAVGATREIDPISGDGLHVTEGMVTRIDRSRQQITIRFNNGASETFRLTDRAAASLGKDIDDVTHVVVYYSDETGQKVAHYFNKTS